MLRRATREDIVEMVELGRRMHAESPRLSRLNYSITKVTELIVSLIESEHGFAHVAVVKGEIVGAALAVIAEEWYSWDLVANELAVFVLPTQRGALIAAQLIREMDAWAHSKTKVLQCGTTTGLEPERTAKLYERLGFSRVAIGLERFYH
jgi:GNAT superfamily N-acetyltransferase